MATTGGVQIRITPVFARKNREVLEGEHCVFKIELVDPTSASGALIADVDVSALSFTLFDKTSGKIINGRSATAIAGPLATKYMGLNELDNAIIPATAGGFSAIAEDKLQVHILRVTATITSALGSLDTVITDYEFPVRRLLIAA